MLAHNIALWINHAMLVERNVRPIVGADGQIVALFSEAGGIAQQEMLTRQFGRLASPAVLEAWHRFLSNPATQEITLLRRNVIAIGGVSPRKPGSYCRSPTGW